MQTHDPAPPIRPARSDRGPGEQTGAGASGPSAGQAGAGDLARRAFASSKPLSAEEMRRAPVRWPRPSRLERPLEVAGKGVAEGLEALGIRTVGALLEHLPRDIRRARTIAALENGEQATVLVKVIAISSRPVRRRGMRPLVQATVADATGRMRATFFNQPWLLGRYPAGTRLLLHGTLDQRGGFRVSHHALNPDAATEIDAGAAEPIREAGTVAHYAAAEGISSTQILTLVLAAGADLGDVLEPLPAAIRVAEGLPHRADALAAMHFPALAGDAEAGRERLAFEELLMMQLAFLRRRSERSERGSALILDSQPELTERWLGSGVPFELTGDQRRAMEVIGKDLRESRPMQRLLMGEVGSGKTVVALFAMLRAVEHGHQAALMAPTETLAEQHFATVQRLLGAEPVTAALLTGSTPAARRREILARLQSGELSLIVGTHALIEPDVGFRALAVAVVDEQHRFGVRQRAALDGKGSPHTLHMTATPIPRTLALTRYGDLEVSALHELPRERRAVETKVVFADPPAGAGAGGHARAGAYEELRSQLRAGRQAYVVCPLVDEAAAPGAGAGEEVELRAATAELERLRGGELEGYELALLHGGMRPREKQAAMAAFAQGQADVLVATTVIEVGIDVPNATVILIENAERFGLSQLHQLRGRVGRGEYPGICMLVSSQQGHPAGPAAGTGEDPEEAPPAVGSGRLRALVEHSDGFRLAEIDLRMRREGELIGTRQSGMAQFQAARLPQDAQLLDRARTWAEAIVRADPSLGKPEHGLLAQALERTYGREAAEPIPA
jgi:ATP-dependent DNA helicase RecG